MTIDRDVVVKTVEAIKDALFEINEPEINELVSGALEKKLEKAQAALELVLA